MHINLMFIYLITLIKSAGLYLCHSFSFVHIAIVEYDKTWDDGLISGRIFFIYICILQTASQCSTPLCVRWCQGSKPGTKWLPNQISTKKEPALPRFQVKMVKTTVVYSKCNVSVLQCAPFSSIF